MRLAERVRGYGASGSHRNPSPFRARPIAFGSRALKPSPTGRGNRVWTLTTSLKIERLTSRPQFLAAAKGVSKAQGAVVVQRLDRGDADPVVRVGFTATRKVGGAVVRNRAKRRLREAARALIPTHGAPGVDYVLIARMGTVARPWDRLLDDVKSALTRLATATAASQTAATVPLSAAIPALPTTGETPGQDHGPA